MSMVCSHYLDEAKRKLALPSDYALAKALALSHSAISNYRSGRSNFDDLTAIKIAKAAGVEPAEVLFAMQVERAKSDETREVWTTLLEKFSKGFRWLALPANAYGAYSPQV
ncbi:Helix-turn-helix domain-containing protein [Burkholderia gladioli]|uniref:helix-turn-helix domain-containing protein n=1 Tax=Burkholderia gladioli TaxID=28095 RepID=UPI001CB4CB31|nr:helix-turn-helix domain-containing protein [Burkholderia gladioli]CAG9221440.1 Helix-turn-helix domain-containing protein [Burkholderia gladioli]